MVHVVDPLQLRVGLERGLVDGESVGVLPVGTHLGEARLELGEVLHGGAGPRVLVLGECERPVIVEDGHERALETPLGNRLGGAALGLHRECVTLLAGETLERGYQVCRDSLRHHVELVAQVRVVRGEAIHVHRRRA